MIKKIMFTSILILNILNAATLETKDQYLTNDNVVIKFTNMEGQNKDWIGIYPQDANNEWKNIVGWAWTDDAHNGEITIPIKNLKIGNRYRVRAFYNNSFKKEAVTGFEVVPIIGIGLGEMTTHYSPNQRKLTVSMYKDWDYPTLWATPKDWIGLYKKNASNEWNNVIRWAWVKDSTRHIYDDRGHYFRKLEFSNLDLESGEYQVRYFADNSFTTYKAINFKTIKEDFTLNLSRIYNHIDGKNLRVGITPNQGASVSPHPTDWIGIYERGKSNDWKNVIQWVWAKDLKKMPNHRTSEVIFKGINLNDGNQYAVRYFRNNSFDTYRESIVYNLDQ